MVYTIFTDIKKLMMKEKNILKKDSRKLMEKDLLHMQRCLSVLGK